MNRLIQALAVIGAIAVFFGLMFSSCATGFGVGRATSGYVIAVTPVPAAPASRPSAASLPTTTDPAVVVILDKLADGQRAQGAAIASLGREVAQIRQQMAERPAPAETEPRWSETRRRGAQSSDCDGCDAGWSRSRRRPQSWR